MRMRRLSLDDQSAAWKPVLGYPHYVVSASGEIYSLPRQGTKGGLVTQRPHRSGYKKALLSNGNVGKYVNVHVVVLSAFSGPRPAGMHAAHLDGNRENNEASNLVWATPKQNYQHRIAHGTAHRGTRHPESKFTDAQLDEVRRLIGRVPNAQIARKFGVRTGVIWNIAKGRTYK
jgi:hypothetical protein